MDEQQHDMQVGVPEGPLRRARLQCVRRLAALWKTSAPVVILSGVRTRTGSVARGQQEMCATPGRDWAPTFEKNPLPVPPQNVFLAKLGRWTFRKPPASRSLYRRIIPRMVDSAPGPDRVVYSCFAADPDASADVLFAVDRHIQDGGYVLLSFSNHLALFPPKGREEADAVEVLRESACTRPLGLQNAANELVCTANNYQL